MDREAGFTLVESLIALALVAMVSLLLFEGMRFTSGAWQRRAEGNAALSQLITVGETVRTTLDNASSPRILQVFEGTPERLSFVSGFGPDQTAPGPARFVQIWQEQAQLLTRSRLIDAPEWSEPVVLLSNLRALQFRYHDGRNGWVQNWPHADRLPRLVEMRVEAETLRHWPAIVVAPGAGPMQH